MELLFIPTVQTCALTRDNAAPPPGMSLWPGVSLCCRSHGNNHIYSQRIEGGCYRLVRFHIMLATRIELIPWVRQRCLAFAFLHRGHVSGRLGSVEGILHFRENYCYIPLLLPDTRQHSLLELEAGTYEVTVILLEKDREAMILDMFPEFCDEHRRLQTHSGKSLPYPPFPFTPELRMLLKPLTHFRDLPAHLPWVADRCVSGLITALHKERIQREHMPHDFHRIYTYLCAHLDAALTVKKVALALRMSERQLCTAIRQHQHTTFKALLTGLRMEQARILMADPGRQQQEIALELGYSSKAHFSQAFRKYCGISPSRYRAAAHQEKSVF